MDDMANKIKIAFDRWQSANIDWIEATLELAKLLYEARQEHASNDEFSTWLDLNGLRGISHQDRSGFVGLGSDVEIARHVLQETDRRSIRHIWAEYRDRFTHLGKTTSHESKTEPVRSARGSLKKKTKAGRPRSREFDFAPKLLAAIRRKRKEANDVRISRRWRPEAVNKIMLHDLLDAIEHFLEDFINHRTASLDAINAIKRDPRAAERSIDYATENECRTGKLDA